MSAPASEVEKDPLVRWVAAHPVDAAALLDSRREKITALLRERATPPASELEKRLCSHATDIAFHCPSPDVCAQSGCVARATPPASDEVREALLEWWAAWNDNMTPEALNYPATAREYDALCRVRSAIALANPESAPEGANDEIRRAAMEIGKVTHGLHRGGK